MFPQGPAVTHRARLTDRSSNRFVGLPARPRHDDALGKQMDYPRK